MPGVQIHGAEYPLSRIFSDEFAFLIPHYQRPYSWTTEQATELLEDLLTSIEGDTAISELEPYFLGNVVLIKNEQLPRAEVVDGQQRLTTLTILLAALAEALPAQQSAEIELFLLQRANTLAGTETRYRLELRERDAQFFRMYIQEPKNLDGIAALNPGQLTDAERNIRSNALALRRELSPMMPERIARLAAFIVQGTYLVVVSTPNLQSAYRIFSVLNERGLNLSAADIFKARVLGNMPEHLQQKYAERWEDLEEALGRDRFTELFSHIRMLFARSKARETIIKEFDTSVFSKTVPGQAFVDDVLVPYAEAFDTIVNCDYKSDHHAADINNLLRWLSRLDNFDWIPPAMLWFSKNGNDESAVLGFLKDLERLAASMLIRRVDITRRIERYGQLLAAIDSGTDLVGSGSPLQLSAEEQKKTVEELGGDLYLSTRVRSYVLLRLDSALSSGGATYDYPTISIEHVLPQEPGPFSGWAAAITYLDQERWVHKLANLVLLTRRKNSQASNYDFQTKKTLYFSGAGGTSPFVLTTQVMSEPLWTVDVLQRRQAFLIAKLASVWRLQATAVMPTQESSAASIGPAILKGAQGQQIGPSTQYDAARIILLESGKPLHYTVIGSEAEKRWPYLFALQSPASSVAASINRAMTDTNQRVQEVFRSDGDGMWGLTEWGKAL